MSGYGKEEWKVIQDIAPRQFKNEYMPVLPVNESTMFFYDGRRVLVKKENGNLVFPVYEELKGSLGGKNPGKEYTYLFTIDGRSFYLGEDVPEDFLLDYGWEDIRIFREAGPKYLCFAGITGWQLYRWYDTHKLCGRCGSRLKKDEKERMLYCPECKHMEYPKICPAVIVAVTDGNRILLSKYAGREYKKYALLAGFAEIGETLEDTVRREVMEEVGLKVKNITYYKSQPWSFTDTLLVGFFCELDGDAAVTLDENELALASWFEREEIPAEYEDASLTNEMMMVFKTSREKKQPQALYVKEAQTEYQTGKRDGEYTLEDYYALPDDRRAELIDGVIYDMVSPTSIHQALLWQIFKQLSKCIEKKNGQCMPFFAPLDVQLDCDDKTMLQPDILIVCDREKIRKGKIYGAPDFVLEILSDSTRKRDMVIKLAKYAAAGVREYWIVDPDKNKVIVHDFEKGNVGIYGFGHVVKAEIFGGACEVDFKEIEKYISRLRE